MRRFLATLFIPACAFLACAVVPDSASDLPAEIATVVAADTPSPLDVLTQHNDNFRSGAALAETTLTVASVQGPSSTFGLIGTLPVTDLVYAQPLYAHGVTMLDGKPHNVVYIADMQNNVLAYDADTLKLITRATSATLGTPDTLPDHTFRNVGTTNAGIMATPVIDRSRGVMFVIVRSAGPKFTLYALDLGSLQPVAHVDISNVSYPFPSGTVTLNPSAQFNRPGLLLSQGVVYAAFAGLADDSPGYRGWILGYALSGSTFVPRGVFATTPPIDQNGNLLEGGGIWQAGNGLAAAPNGDIYFITGNGLHTHPKPPQPPVHPEPPVQIPATPAGQEESLVHLRPSGTTLSVVGKRYPQEYPTLEAHDTDFGSGGALLIPGTTKVVGGGKMGALYVADQSFSGTAPLATNGVDGFQAFTNQWENLAPSQYAANMPNAPHIHGSPVYLPAQRSTAAWIYAWSEKDRLKRFTYDPSTGKLDMNAEDAVRGPLVSAPGAMPGGTLSVSANGSTPATGLVWATTPDPFCRSGEPRCNGENQKVQGRLYVFDAALLEWMWESEPFTYAKFVPPTIANGRVYVATSDKTVRVYGLGATNRPPTFPGGAATGSVSIDANTIDAFAVDESGQLQQTRWANAPWTAWSPVGTGQLARFEPGSRVTAVSRTAGHVDVFVADANGGIETNWWDAGSDKSGRWEHPWRYAMPPGSVPVGANIAVVARMAGHLDLFAVGDQGDVVTTWWDRGGPDWSGSPEHIMTGLGGYAGGGIAAVARDPSHLDVFAVDSTGAIRTTWWDATPANGQWTAATNVTPPATLPGIGAIAAVARLATHIDLVFVDNANNLATTWWDSSAGWALTAPEITSGGVLSAGGAVSLVARASTHLDAFAIGYDGTLVTNWWDAASPTFWNATQQSAASAERFSGGMGSLSVVSRSGQQLDVFSVDIAGKLTSSWWAATSVCTNMNDRASTLPPWVMTPCWQNQPWLP